MVRKTPSPVAGTGSGSEVGFALTGASVGTAPVSLVMTCSGNGDMGSPASPAPCPAPSRAAENFCTVIGATPSVSSLNCWMVTPKFRLPIRARRIISIW